MYTAFLTCYIWGYIDKEDGYGVDGKGGERIIGGIRITDMMKLKVVLRAGTVGRVPNWVVD